MKATFWSIAVCASLALLAVAALIAFGTVEARDGADLYFREYAADSRQVVANIGV
jgi:hypothetical protein